MTRSVEPSAPGGRVQAPASKSSMQRALACAAMARGTSTITNPTWCEDSVAAMGVAQALGAGVERFDDRAVIRGGFRAPGGSAISVSCGESGLCLRMFSAIAALLSVDVELRGEGSLATRPVGMVEAPLSSLGARCTTAGGFQPVHVRGPLLAGTVTVDGSESSQFLTGLLLALPMAGEGRGGQRDSVVSVKDLVSRGYIDMTLDVMRTFGAEVGRDDAFTEFRIRGGQPYLAADHEVEGDWSAAAFLLVAGAIAAAREPLEVVGLSPESSQPDRAILDALLLAGARLEKLPGGWRVRSGPLRSFSFDATGCPDLFPPLVALASRCSGVTEIRGASRLKAKESDRAAALSGEFGKLGLEVGVEGDLLTVRGLGCDGGSPGGRLRGGSLSSRGDHRIAMAAAVATLAGSGPVSIEGADCVAKSWPGFFEALDSMLG